MSERRSDDDAQEAEVRRLEAVYKTYREDPETLARWSDENPGNRLIVAERRARLGELLRAEGLLPLSSARILDVGCGDGRELAALRDWGAAPDNLFGVDLLEDRVQAARARFPALHFEQGNAERLPFDDGAFRIVQTYTVFSSILDPDMAAHVAAEITRVLQPGGCLVWYDFRFDNPRNPHVRGIRRGRLKALFPGFEGRIETITPLPPLVRRLGGGLDRWYPRLARLPLLCTHYLGLLRKPA